MSNPNFPLGGEPHIQREAELKENRTASIIAKKKELEKTYRCKSDRYTEPLLLTLAKCQQSEIKYKIATFNKN